MDDRLEAGIVEAERRLRQAMLRSDVIALDELLAPDLIFTNHLGQIMTKQDDLAAHQSGAVRVDELTPSDEHVRMHGHVGVVSVRVRIAGCFAGVASAGDFRFTRVWARSPDGTWRVVAAHSSLVA